MAALFAEIAECSQGECRAYMFELLFSRAAPSDENRLKMQEVYLRQVRLTDLRVQEAAKVWHDLSKEGIDQVTSDRIEAGFAKASQLPLWRQVVTSSGELLPQEIGNDPYLVERAKQHVANGMDPVVARSQALWDLIRDIHYTHFNDYFCSMLLDVARVTRDARMARQISLHYELGRLQALIERENGLIFYFTTAGARPHGLRSDDIGWLRSIWDRETSAYQNAWSLAEEDGRRLIEAKFTTKAYPHLDRVKQWLAEKWINVDMANWCDLDVSQMGSDALRQEVNVTRDYECARIIRQLRSEVVAEADARIVRERGILLIVSGTLGLGGLFLFLGYRWLKRAYIIRVLELCTMAHRVRETGDTSLRIHSGMEDEIGELEESINEMLASLEDGRRRLEEARQVLETRVAERTAEVQNRLAEVERLNHDLKETMSALRVSKHEADLSAGRLTEMNHQLLVANQELESFTYTASHDLRTPIRNINGFIELFLRHTERSLDIKALHHIEVVMQETKRLNGLIDALLEFSRIGNSQLRDDAVQIIDLVDEVRRELSVEVAFKEIEWTVGNMPGFRGDRTLMRQVVSILLDNAIKFSAGRKPIQLEVGGGTGVDGNLVFHVKDNGVGFNPEYADKLFRVFQRLHSVREFPGNGMGLANARRIITRHGGRMWAVGAVDRGACFYFSIPGKRAMGL